MPAELKGIDRNSRAIEEMVRLEATPEVVWRALTDGEELVRWFPATATVQPGVGGSISLSWGPIVHGLESRLRDVLAASIESSAPGAV